MSIGTCHTDGKGLWSTVAKPVKITELDVAYIKNSSLFDSDFGELRVYFSRLDWDTGHDGLIYTDKLWIKEFRALLISVGFSTKAALDIEYSEQGMQGDDFVSLDIGGLFLKECDPFVNFAMNEEKTVKIKVTSYP